MHKSAFGIKSLFMAQIIGIMPRCYDTLLLSFQRFDFFLERFYRINQNRNQGRIIYKFSSLVIRKNKIRQYRFKFLRQQSYFSVAARISIVEQIRRPTGCLGLASFEIIGDRSELLEDLKAIVQCLYSCLCAGIGIIIDFVDLYAVECARL